MSIYTAFTNSIAFSRQPPSAAFFSKLDVRPHATSLEVELTLGYTFLALALEVLALLQVLRLVRIMREVTHDMSREMSHGSTVRVWQRNSN